MYGLKRENPGDLFRQIMAVPEPQRVPWTAAPHPCVCDGLDVSTQHGIVEITPVFESFLFCGLLAAKSHL